MKLREQFGIWSRAFGRGVFPHQMSWFLDLPGRGLIMSAKTVAARLPLGPEYDKQIDCDAADMKNIGGGRAGGSITAAQFLQRFIKNGLPWAHLDIAGVAWSAKEKATVPKGGTGFGVRLLDAFVAETYEK